MIFKGSCRVRFRLHQRRVQVYFCLASFYYFKLFVPSFKWSRGLVFFLRRVINTICTRYDAHQRHHFRANPPANHDFLVV
jgi:hypothetical protein